MVKNASNSIRRLVVICLLCATAQAWADGAGDARRCLLPASLTGRTCSEAECIALSDAVHAPDACGGVRSCERISGCSALRSMRQTWLNCYTARNIVNARCWSGGDYDHQWQAAEAIRHVGICDVKIAMPEPTGCGDPCAR
jgi:hypothetical protein